ncbi:MAG: extradiol dioxygenase family protein [Marinoscillum sp.]|jgi:extradiol dioxygenase family protein
MQKLTPFHLAIPVADLDQTRAFYNETLGLSEGRSSEHWVDFDFFGHQLVLHLSGELKKDLDSNPVDGHDVPIPHFGVVLEMPQWQALADRLTGKGIHFLIAPHIRFKGQVGEQATMFFKDPSGNALEFKAFADFSQLFAK